MTQSSTYRRACWIDRCQVLPVRSRTGALFYKAGAVVAVSLLLTGLAIAAQRSRALDGMAIAQAVESFFASQPDYQKGDLITRSQIEKVIAKFQAAGVKVTDGEQIAKLGLADDSFLVRELSTTEGRRFMRKVARDAGGYSHLDRLSAIPRGQTIVHDLVRQKDGEKFVEYLATTKGGQRMGGMMAQTRGGVDLNKPTGRIYTADDLIAALKGAIENK